MAGTFEASTINVISPNGLVTKTITATDSGYLTVPSPQFSDAINLTSGRIKFPATQVPSSDANTLDDYEEGTWTPTLQFGGNSVGITYSIQSGQYIKIGRQVFVSFVIQLSNKGSSTGNASVIGFPFIVGGWTPYTGNLNIGYATNFTTNSPTCGYSDGSQYGVNLFYIESATGSYISNGHFQNTSFFMGNISYITNN